MGDDNWLMMDFTFVPIMVKEEKVGVFVIRRDISELLNIKSKSKR
jgi:hypothetical protein